MLKEKLIIPGPFQFYYSDPMTLKNLSKSLSQKSIKTRRHILIMWSHKICPTDHDLPGDEQRSKPLEADPRRALPRHQFKNSPFLAEGPT